MKYQGLERHVMERPDWVAVLNTAYESKHGVIKKPSAEGDEGFDRPDIPPEKEVQIFNYLDNTGILDKLTDTKYRLTHDGLLVAHDRLMKERQQDLMESQNRATKILALFTVVLGVSALVQTFATIMSSPLRDMLLAIVSLLPFGAF